MKIDDKKLDLKKELMTDINELKRVSITSDGGRSNNKLKTKKNSVTVHRIDPSWRLKQPWHWQFSVLKYFFSKVYFCTLKYFFEAF